MESTILSKSKTSADVLEILEHAHAEVFEVDVTDREEGESRLHKLKLDLFLEAAFRVAAKSYYHTERVVTKLAGVFDQSAVSAEASAANATKH